MDVCVYTCFNMRKGTCCDGLDGSNDNDGGRELERSQNYVNIVRLSVHSCLLPLLLNLANHKQARVEEAFHAVGHACRLIA